MPKQLHMVIYHNQRLLYDLIYRAVAETLTELSQDYKYLGAQIGFFSVLAGGLSSQNNWRNTSKKFFIPVKVLSKKF